MVKRKSFNDHVSEVFPEEGYPSSIVWFLWNLFKARIAYPKRFAELTAHPQYEGYIIKALKYPYYGKPDFAEYWGFPEGSTWSDIMQIVNTSRRKAGKAYLDMESKEMVYPAKNSNKRL